MTASPPLYPAMIYEDSGDVPEISKREMEVLRLLIQGHTMYGTAVSLELSLHTVRAHINSIYRKLHVGSRGQLAASAIAYGIISVDEVRQMLNIRCIQQQLNQTDDCFLQENL